MRTTMLKEHEKLIAFVAILLAVMSLAYLNYAHPVPDKSDSSALMSQIVGGLMLALGAAGQSLFRIRDGGETVTVDNKASNPVPTEPQPPAAPVTNLLDASEEGLPDYARG